MLSRIRVLLFIGMTASILFTFGDVTLATGIQDKKNKQAEPKIDFVKQIKPLIEQRCLRCHGPEKQEADFRVDDRETVFYYLEPGDPENSEWQERLVTDDIEFLMPPPDEGGPLAEDEVDLFERWIAEGAEWPENIVIEPPAEPDAADSTKPAQESTPANEQNTWQLLWDICGLVHPFAVHFPVALLIGGAIFAVLGFRGESPLSDAAYYCLWLGALGSIFACITGWSFGIHEEYLNWQSFEFERTIDLHRWGGVLIAVLALLLAMVASVSRRRDPYGTGALWKLSLILLAGLVGFVGHQGGELSHGVLHKELLHKANIVVENIRGESQSTVEPVKGDDEANSQKEKEKSATSDNENDPDKQGDGKSSDDGKIEGSAETSDEDQ